MPSHITIAIPTYNRADPLAETLRSVAGLQVPCGISCDVLVVDNSSPDHTQAVVEAAAQYLQFPVRCIVETRQGVCFGRNRALTEARGDYILFLDDDVFVGETWLEGCVRAINRFSADCIVGPVFPVYPQPLPAHANDYVLGLLGSGYSRKGTTSFVLPKRLTHNIPGCNFAVRRQTALAVGGFDTSLDRVGSRLLAGGDTEFGLRLGKRQRVVVYEPDCWIQHIISPGKLDPGYLRRRADGLGMTSAKLRALHGPRWALQDWIKMTKRAAGLWVRWQHRRWSGNTIGAFEWELRTRRHVMNLWGSFSQS
jgi:glycosyltransferase involved in cell wall biosynthesis